MSAYREWRERVAKAWNDEHDVMRTNLWRALANQPLMPPEVLELQRRYEEDTEQFWDIRQAGDQVAIDRNGEYHDDVARAAHRSGIHDLCSHHVNYEPPDNDEHMSSRGYAGKPVGVVWGTVNPDGSVTARGFRDDESYSEDTAVHSAMSLVAYRAGTDTWVHMATGQTTARQREIDAERAERAERAEADVNDVTKGAVEGVSKITPTGLATTALSGATGKDIKPPIAAAATGGTSGGGGAGVSHAEEGNAQIQQAGQDIEAAMGAIQEIVSNLEAAQQNLTGAAEGSQHSEADTAMGALQEAVSAANDLQQQVGAAKQAVEDVKL